MGVTYRSGMVLALATRLRTLLESGTGLREAAPATHRQPPARGRRHHLFKQASELHTAFTRNRYILETFWKSQNKAANDDPLDHAALLASLNGMAHALGRHVVPNEPSDDLTCRVCFANPREICLKPCNHVVVCKTCLLKMVTTPHHRLECPICRAPWTTFEHVFL